VGGTSRAARYYAEPPGSDSTSPRGSAFLAVISPGLLGSGYFRGVADVFAGGGPPDIETIGEVMRRHGLTPAPPT
jgi:hypothetical protein